MDIRRDMVSDSLARWHLEEQVAERFARDERQSEATWHVVAFSREVGSGGATVARLVAQQLGFTLYDREILTSMAERLQADIRHVEAMDEAVPSALDNILRGAMEHIPSTASYRRILAELMHEIAARGRVVILGRGCTILVPHALRVRVVAPMDVRVARVGELEGLTPSRARKLVEDIDRKRRAFFHVHFRRDADDCTSYDLVINTERTSLEHAADLVLCAVQRRRAAVEEAASRSEPEQ
jgi:cytidylate kinase